MSGPINPALAQGATDVPPDPSPGQGGQPADPPQSATPPVPDAGQGASGAQSGQADPGEPKEPRTPDNVRGEMLRKMGERDSAVDQRLARMEGMLQNMASQPATPTPSSAPAQPTIETMSSQQLEGLRSQVPAERHAELDALVTQRRIDESIATGIDRRLSEQQAREQRVDANTTAYGRWPELRDQGSQLYQMANHVLNERGDTVTRDPRALLDASNEAGMRLGLQPKSYSPQPSHFGVPHGSQPPATPASKGLTRDEAATIAQKLKGAMPGGKFNLDRVVERSGEYEDHRELFIRQ